MTRAVSDAIYNMKARWVHRRWMTWFTLISYALMTSGIFFIAAPEVITLILPVYTAYTALVMLIVSGYFGASTFDDYKNRDKYDEKSYQVTASQEVFHDPTFPQHEVN